MKIFLLTRLSRGATNKIMIYGLYTMISTHAPLARRDISMVLNVFGAENFYSRASREARLNFSWIVFLLKLFLLTRLSRGATATISSMIAVPHHISLEADFFSHSYHIFMPENRIFGY